MLTVIFLLDILAFTKGIQKYSMVKATAKQKILLAVLVTFLSLTLLEIGLRSGGFILLALQERRNLNSLNKDGRYRILCLGESTTYLGKDNSYPRQLEHILNDKNLGMHFSVINRGMPATNTSSILANLEKDILKYHPDMIITMMGINDDYNILMPDAYDNSTRIPFLHKLKIYRLFHIVHLQSNKLLHKFLYPHKGTPEINPADSQQDVCANYATMLHRIMKYKHFNLFINYANMTIDYSSRRFLLELPGCPSNEIDFDKGIKALTDNIKELIRQYPFDRKLHIALSVSYFLQNDWKTARATIKKAQNNFKINKSTLYNLVARTSCGIIDDCSENIVKIIKTLLGPDFNEAGKYVELAEYYERENNIYDTEKTFYGIVKEAKELYSSHNIKFSLPSVDAPYLIRSVHLKFLNELNDPHTIRKLNYWQEELYYKFYLLYGQLQQDISQTMSSDLLKDKSQHTDLLSRITAERKRIKEALEFFLHDSPAKMPRYFMTEQNYNKLKSLVEGKHIKLVSVQYPMLSLRDLTNLFNDTSGIVFVDNEKIFKDAVRQHGYDIYFIDNFAGLFGHCTAEGNKLLATNIAYTIIKSGILDSQLTAHGLQQNAQDNKE